VQRDSGAPQSRDPRRGWTPDQQRITSCCAASGERQLTEEEIITGRNMPVDQARNLADVVRVQGKERGNAPAFEFEGRQTTFAEFNVNTNRVANALIAMGLKKGDASPISARTATSISSC
jgi:hypothetical protein